MAFFCVIQIDACDDKLILRIHEGTGDYALEVNHERFKDHTKPRRLRRSSGRCTAPNHRAAGTLSRSHKGVLPARYDRLHIFFLPGGYRFRYDGWCVGITDLNLHMPDDDAVKVGRARGGADAEITDAIERA
jgi:hypothetical protein